MLSVVCQAGLQYMAERIFTPFTENFGHCSPACEGELPDLAGCAQMGPPRRLPGQVSAPKLGWNDSLHLPSNPLSICPNKHVTSRLPLKDYLAWMPAPKELASAVWPKSAGTWVSRPSKTGPRHWPRPKPKARPKAPKPRLNHNI